MDQNTHKQRMKQMRVRSPLFSATNQKFNIIILAAGLGTRLKPATDFIPKALVEIGGPRAIDYCIEKYQYISGRIIIAAGYSSDLLINYVSGKYPSLNLFFSIEEVSELKGPGTSLLYALDYASSRLPTIITFCDYIVGDQFSVEYDGIGVCKPTEDQSVLGTYDTVAEIEEGFAVDLVKNKDRENVRENGFTGISICHNTKLLKSITYGADVAKNDAEQLDYTLDIIRGYIKRVKTAAIPLSKLYEFGTDEILQETRRQLNENI